MRLFLLTSLKLPSKRQFKNKLRYFKNCHLLFYKLYKQVGVTVVGDGEMSKPSYVSYVNERSESF